MNRVWNKAHLDLGTLVRKAEEQQDAGNVSWGGWGGEKALTAEGGALRSEAP